jgi:hypothetical protein
MTLPKNILDKKQQSYVDAGEDATALRITKAEQDILTMKENQRETLACLGKIADLLELNNTYLQILTGEDL